MITVVILPLRFQCLWHTQSLFPSLFLPLYVFTPIYCHYLHLFSSSCSSNPPPFPISHPPLLSASARDAIFPADLLILNDACKLLLSIAGLIYLLTNYYPWCSELCVCLSVSECVSSDCGDEVPWPLVVQPALSVYLHPLSGWDSHLVAYKAHAYAWPHTHTFQSLP